MKVKMQIENSVITAVSIGEYGLDGDEYEIEEKDYDGIIAGLSRYVDGKIINPTDEQLEMRAKAAAESNKQYRYERRVESLIRKKYTVSQELALLRQRDTKPEEYAEYNAYAEQCKINAKAEILQ